MATRTEVDVAHVRALAAASGSRVGIVALPVPGRARFVLELGWTTVASNRYPEVRQPSSRIAIDLAPRHPFQPPVTTVLTPIFHPHVFPSGVVCVGSKWLPSEGMDLFVRRLVRLLAFDPLLMNPQSIADGAANAWYQAALRRHPEAFPTDVAALAWAVEEPARPRASSPDAKGEPAVRVIRHCPHCRIGLRLPAGRSGSVRCPRCGTEFLTST